MLPFDLCGSWEREDRDVDHEIHLYFAEDVVPGCTEFSEGLNALDLNGNLLWCKSFSGVSRAVASPNGDALVHDFGVLYDYNPDGTRDWSFTFPFPSGPLIGPDIAPDGTIYIFHSYTNLWSLTPAGTKRWEADGIAGSNFPVVPTVSPDGTVVVFATVFSFGVNGKVVAVYAADGAVLWTLPSRDPRLARPARSRSVMMVRPFMSRSPKSAA